MKVLFAVSNEEISESIVKKYQKEYKEIISYKNVYYFNAILKEIQKDKSYDRIVISEDLEAFSNTQYVQIDKFIFEKLDSISDEASNIKGNDTPIILICSDRREKGEEMLVKLFGIGIYNAILGNDRSVDEVCKLIYRPKLKKEAKNYYQIDSEEVKYEAESENDVSELEIQNILKHYKSLAGNEERYVESFNNIAAQYNETQLRIITKFLPINVRAVLEEQSPTYQRVMSFNNSVNNDLRYRNSREQKKQEEGTSEKLLRTENSKDILNSRPVVIPSSVNMTGGKKLSKQKPKEIENVQEEESINKEEFVNKEEIANKKEFVNKEKLVNKEEAILENEEPEEIKTIIKDSKPIKEEPVEPVKRGRGRPRKNVVENSQEEDTTQKRGRGRPRKNKEMENQEEILTRLPQKPVQSIEELNQYDDDDDDKLNVFPGFEEDEDEVNSFPGFDEDDDEVASFPGFDEDDDEVASFPGLEEDDDEDEVSSFPGLEDDEKAESYAKSKFDETEDRNTLYGYGAQSNRNTLYETEEPYQPIYRETKKEYIQTIDLTSYLTGNKKLVSFVGTSKNGTSFIINNVAQVLSSLGINTAILDMTQNRNAYYIYTKNEDELRNIAASSIRNLSHGQANGIKVNNNLTVYTSLPDGDYEEHVDEILQTLVQNHTVVLIDCDFKTSYGYFKQSQEIYLVQTYDILTIQPLTAFLRDLKAKNILDENKLKIIINKAMKIRGVTDQTIIGGMAFYNDPSMSFMTELFDRNRMRNNYVNIPFDQEVYSQYLENVINCEMNIKGYNKNFTQILRSLSSFIYPVTSSRAGSYTPPSTQNNKYNSFSPSMNNTLDQMKRKY